MNEPASVVYQLEREHLPAWRRFPRTVVVVIANLLSMGSGPANPGGGRVSIIERSTGRTLITLTEELGDDGHGAVSSISADLSQMSADDFATKWL